MEKQLTETDSTLMRLQEMIAKSYRDEPMGMVTSDVKNITNRTVELNNKYIAFMEFVRNKKIGLSANRIYMFTINTELENLAVYHNKLNLLVSLVAIDVGMVVHKDKGIIRNLCNSLIDLHNQNKLFEELLGNVEADLKKQYPDKG